MSWDEDLRRGNAALAAAGVTVQERESNGAYEARVLVPLKDGRRVAFTSAVRPTVEVGAGAFAKKMKAKLKKVAKSKAFKRFSKAAMFLAPMVPNPRALISGVTLIGAAKKKAKAAPPPKKAAPKPAKKAPPPKKAAPKPAKKAPPPKKAAPKPVAKKAPPPKKAAPKPVKRALPPPPKKAAPAPLPPVEEPTPVEEAMAEAVEPETFEPLEESYDAPPDEEAIETDGEETSYEAEAMEPEDVAEMEEVGALMTESDALLRAAGVVGQGLIVNGTYVYRYLVPLADGRRVQFIAAARPRVEIGAGKVAKKIKKGLKKVVKSKAFGKILGGLGKLASIVPIPGASTLGKGLDFAAKAQKKLQGVKKKVKAALGTGSPKKALPAGRPAPTARAAAVRTAAKPVPQKAATRPLSAAPGVMVALPNGRKALVTFVT